MIFVKMSIMIYMPLQKMGGKGGLSVAQKWDDTTKRLIKSHPQDFVSWMVQGATFVEYVSGELKNWTLTTDMLMSVLVQGQEMLLHLEIQSKEDRTMAQRLLEYNVLATREHKRPVFSCVLYLRQDRRLAEPPLRWSIPSGRQTLIFDFLVFRLWEIPSEELFHKGLIGLLPLVPLTREGHQRETVDRMIQELIASQQLALLPLSEIIAGLVWKEKTEREWLQRRFAMYEDILEDSWVYQEILHKGLEQGINKGLEQGVQQETRRLRQVIYTILQSRFPDLMQDARVQIERASQPEALQELIVKLSLAQHAQEAQQALDAVDD
jgi:predicted transposase YdaD